MKLDETGRLSITQLSRVESIISLAASDARTAIRYYRGDNPTIIDAAAKTAPDNRIASPFARKIVNTVKGYGFKPGYITYRTEDDYQKELKAIFDNNNEELLTAELATDVLVNGQAFELLRIAEDGKTIRQYRIEPGTGAAVYDDTLDQSMIAFVHIVTIQGETVDVVQRVRTVYYKDKYITTTGSGKEWQAEGVYKSHPFKDIPAIEYNCSMDKISLFQAVKGLIDSHDKIISDSYVNEGERFSDAYLRVIKKLPADIATKIKELRIFDDLGDSSPGESVANKVDFLTKPDRGASTAESADRFERLIYDLSMVINPNDEGFGTASGIALRYKLLPMEFLMADIESYFSKGLQRRIKLIDNATGNAKPVTLNWRRNIPIDIDALAATVGNLKGTLSDETILKLFPADIIPDQDAEMKRLEEAAMNRLPDIDKVVTA